MEGKRGGKGFGYVSSKNTKYICRAKNVISRLRLDSSNTHERGFVILINNPGEAQNTILESESVSVTEKVKSVQR